MDSLPTLSAEPTTVEVYLYIRAYFSQPGAVLAKDGFGCQYRTKKGHKCAVGCLISDELYDTQIDYGYDDGETLSLGESIEENPVDEIAHNPLLIGLLDGPSEEGQRKLAFLRGAQQLHDSVAHNAADFVRLLDALAIGADVIDRTRPLPGS